MAHENQVFYMDTSALVKRYMREQGTEWIRSICANPTHTIAIAEFGMVEMASAFAGKHRGGFISLQQYSQALSQLLLDAKTRYRLVRVEQSIIQRAIDLTTRHRLRGYDAIHLACALKSNQHLIDSALVQLTFVCADKDLLQAASTEKLMTHNPN